MISQLKDQGSAEPRSRLKKLLSNFSSIIGNDNEKNLETRNEEKKQTIIDLEGIEPIRDYAPGIHHTTCIFMYIM